MTVEREDQAERGWRFEVAVEAGGAAAGGEGAGVRRHVVTLSWADYEHWSHGRLAPEHIVRSVVEILLRRGEPRELPARFDASTARRWVRDLDREMERAPAE